MDRLDRYIHGFAIHGLDLKVDPIQNPWINESGSMDLPNLVSIC